MTRALREECGVVGVIGDDDAAKLICLSLHALQHRGQEGCGIVTLAPAENGGAEAEKFRMHKSFKLVSEAFPEDILSKLRGAVGIGHVRYSTQGGKLIQNIQPFHFRTGIGQFAIAHNGNLTNAQIVREELEASGSIFQSTSDTEIFVHLLARAPGQDITQRVLDVLKSVSGAYSMVLMAKDRLFAIRDPYGFRPLVLGKRGQATIVASETCALDLVDADFIREVEAGEVVEITPEGMTSHFPLPKRQTAFCSFEPIYFARPDSTVFGEVVYGLRKRMGAVLAEEAPAEGADVVIAIPDSGVPMAMGYAEHAKLPLELGLVRNHYVGRTFIEPSQAIRDFGVKLKLNPVISALKGKNVVVVDDSIVRGTTSEKIVRLLKKAGANRIHFRIGSPPITHSCYYGVDTPRRTQLLAAQQNVQQIRERIGCDTLAYLSPMGLRKAINDAQEESRFCLACFNGEYPEVIHDTVSPQPTDNEGPGTTAGL